MGKFQRHQVGNAEIIALQDSWAAMPPSAFYPDVPADAWAGYSEFLDGDGNLTLNLGAWLVVSEGNHGPRRHRPRRSPRAHAPQGRDGAPLRDGGSRREPR